MRGVRSIKLRYYLLFRSRISRFIRIVALVV